MLKISNKVLIFFLMVWQGFWTRSSSLSRFHEHTQTHSNWYDSSGSVISPTQRPLPDKTQHSHQRDIHAPGGIRTHNPSKQAAADPLLRPCGHWDRQNLLLRLINRNFLLGCQRFLILANNQLDALFLMYLFISSLYMLRASQCSSSGDRIVLIHYLV